MSEGFVEASIEDPVSGAKVSVIQGPGKTTRTVQFDNWVDQHACSDFLASIIVRGIRSLEEERAVRCARDPVAVVLRESGRHREELLDIAGHGAG